MPMIIGHDDGGTVMTSFSVRMGGLDTVAVGHSDAEGLFSEGWTEGYRSFLQIYNHEWAITYGNHDMSFD